MQQQHNAAGYGETLGEQEVANQFEKYLDMKEVNPARVTLTHEHVDDFLVLLTKQSLREDDEGSATPKSLSCLGQHCVAVCCLLQRLRAGETLHLLTNLKAPKKSPQSRHGMLLLSQAVCIPNPPCAAGMGTVVSCSFHAAAKLWQRSGMLT